MLNSLHLAACILHNSLLSHIRKQTLQRFFIWRLGDVLLASLEALFMQITLLRTMDKIMKEIPVIIFGIGGVGHTLIQQIIASRSAIANSNSVTFKIVALIDSRQWLFVPKGISDSDLTAAVERKAAGNPLGGSERPSAENLMSTIVETGIKNAIVLDVTAVEGMEPAIDLALASGYGIALANKKPHAGLWEQAQKYYQNPAVRHESTVGGGEPIIATLRYLSDINDTFYSCEGQLSGTLGFMCRELEKGRPFSEALAEAKGLGYTEPDPRDDLSGEDVMRKVLIMGRMAGWHLEQSDFEVESLYDADMADCSVAEFVERSAQMDAKLAKRFADAKAAGKVLRYIGRVTENGGKVGLMELDANSPMANLKYIQFHTDLYDAEPLMIIGAGAGLEMTAGGVLGDMISLAREVL
ncbi:MAG: homoserine dehydrogenase [Cellvibrionaceae bacterium]|jgi:homoserine dehydrogenase